MTSSSTRATRLAAILHQPEVAMAAIRAQSSLNHETGCWEWQRARARKGYGVISLFGGALLAHRASFVAFKGRLPIKLVCHTCDSPPCVNPDHLWDGTEGENTRDMVAKGRHRSGYPRREGEAHPRAKLSAEQAEEARRLRQAGASLTEFTRQCGVSEATMRRAARGLSWKSISKDGPQ